MMLLYRFFEHESQTLVYYQFGTKKCYCVAYFNFEFIVYKKFLTICMLFADNQRLEFTFVGCYVIMIKSLNAFGCVYFD